VGTVEGDGEATYNHGVFAISLHQLLPDVAVLAELFREADSSTAQCALHPAKPTLSACGANGSFQGSPRLWVSL
jgi:hypothetical protein